MHGQDANWEALQRAAQQQQQQAGGASARAPTSGAPTSGSIMKSSALEDSARESCSPAELEAMEQVRPPICISCSDASLLPATGPTASALHARFLNDYMQRMGCAAVRGSISKAWPSPHQL